jgi:hypothetical protein
LATRCVVNFYSAVVVTHDRSRTIGSWIKHREKLGCRKFCNIGPRHSKLTCYEVPGAVVFRTYACTRSIQSKCFCQCVQVTKTETPGNFNGWYVIVMLPDWAKFRNLGKSFVPNLPTRRVWIPFGSFSKNFATPV